MSKNQSTKAIRQTSLGGKNLWDVRVLSLLSNREESHGMKSTRECSYLGRSIYGLFSSAWNARTQRLHGMMKGPNKQRCLSRRAQNDVNVRSIERARVVPTTKFRGLQCSCQRQINSNARRQQSAVSHYASLQLALITTLLAQVQHQLNIRWHYVGLLRPLRR